VIDGIEQLRTELDRDLGDRLDELITTAEVAALRVRLAELSVAKVFPRAPGHRTPIPWPPL